MIGAPQVELPPLTADWKYERGASNAVEATTISIADMIGIEIRQLGALIRADDGTDPKRLAYLHGVLDGMVWARDPSATFG